VGYIIKNARVHTNDPGAKMAVVTITAFVKAPIYVVPPYASFYGSEKRDPAVTGEVKAGLDKPLTLEPSPFSLEGKVNYEIQEIQEGRIFHIHFRDVAGSSEDYKGYLNLNTNYPEKPTINVRIIGRFLGTEGNRDKAAFNTQPGAAKLEARSPKSEFDRSKRP
jgi:hypothetical protein